MYNIVCTITSLSNIITDGLGSKEEIINALFIMGKGMLGIFVALSIIYLFTISLTKLFPPKEENEEKNNENTIK